MVKQASELKSFRVAVGLLARMEALARSKRVKFAAIHRFALERGVSAMEKEASPMQDAQRRKVISRGVY